MHVASRLQAVCKRHILQSPTADWAAVPLCRSFYIRLRDWILTTEVDSYRSGRVFEYMWPVMFGEPAVTAPVPECDLLHCYEPAVPDAWGRRGGPARSLPD